MVFKTKHLSQVNLHQNCNYSALFKTRKIIPTLNFHENIIIFKRHIYQIKSFLTIKTLIIIIKKKTIP